MRIVWDVLEGADRIGMSVLDRVDRLLGRKPVFERMVERTKNVRAPQRVIEFDK